MGEATKLQTQGETEGRMSPDGEYLGGHDESDDLEESCECENMIIIDSIRQMILLLVTIVLVLKLFSLLDNFAPKYGVDIYEDDQYLTSCLGSYSHIIDCGDIVMKKMKGDSSIKVYSIGHTNNQSD